MRDGLAHVEDERLAVATDRSRLDHELNGFLDGHEVASDVRVGDRDRTTVRDLRSEGGEHRPPTAEHVAEPHERKVPSALCATAAVRPSASRLE